MKYIIDFSKYYEHLCDIQLDFNCQHNAPKLWMPTWIAGSYLIREFSKHITSVHYQIGNQTHKAQKINKNTFVLEHAKLGDRVQVNYEVYCHDLSVRTAFIDCTRIFGNFSSLLLFVEQQHDTMAQVSLSVPLSFLHHLNQYLPNKSLTFACGLSYVIENTDKFLIYHLPFMPAFEYTDYPFEIAAQDQFDFECVDGDQNKLTHRFFISGRHNANLNRLRHDVSKICQSYINWLKDAPFDNYTFLTMVTANDYGGLEHINSTALITPRTDLPTCDENVQASSNYQRFLGLCSHEYFHAWWVKSVQPDVMHNNLLQAESYTPLLWVFEGFTSYIDDMMLLVSGVIDKKNYLKLLESQINRYLQNDGRFHQSVAESSFDTWIKLYRPDENTSNQSVSYYNKGALVALLLDLTLLQHSKGQCRLFDVIRIFYQQSKLSTDKKFPMTSDNLSKVMVELLGQSTWQQFYQDYIVGTAKLPLQDLLEKFDIDWQGQTTQKPWGISYEKNELGLKVNHLHRNSAASLAGVSANDIIIAIENLKANETTLKAAIQKQKSQQKPIQIHVFRRDELLVFDIQPNTITQHSRITLTGEGADWLSFHQVFASNTSV